MVALTRFLYLKVFEPCSILDSVNFYIFINITAQLLEVL